MGVYRSIFETTAEDRKTKLSPNKGDWITGHADLTGCMNFKKLIK